MSAGPTTAAGQSVRLSGCGGAAFNSQTFFAGRFHLPTFGLLRAARFLTDRSRALFKLRNNPLRYISDVFKFGGNAPVGRRIAGWAYRPSGARPVVTKILVGPDCGPILTNALCCTTGQIITQEYDVVLHDQKHGVEAFDTCAKVTCRENRK